MAISIVAFDIGEVIIDETRMWDEWAERIGISSLTFAAALGATIAARRHHREVFAMLRPGFDVAAALRRQSPSPFCADDIYPDAAPCLARLRAGGYRIAIAGNQPAQRIAEMRALGIAADVMEASAGWGVAKPAPEFFARLAAACGVPAGDIAYVGDRLDNDVLPAKQAGMVAVFLRRGPWGVIHATWPEVAEADLRIESLAELPDALSRLQMRDGGR